MQTRFMSSTGPNPQRLFSQQSFEESLQILNQLSSTNEPCPEEKENTSSKEICWDEVAQDVEEFLLQGCEEEEITIGDNPESTSHSS